MVTKFVCADMIHQMRDYVEQSSSELKEYMIRLLSRYTPDKDPFAVAAWRYNTLDRYGYPRHIRRSNGSYYQPHQETGKGTGWFLVDDYNDLLVSMIRSGAIRVVETNMEIQIGKVDKEIARARKTLSQIERGGMR